MSGVVMLVNEFSPLPVGGAELQAERLSAYLAARGWSVRVLTRSAPGLPAFETRAGFKISRPRSVGPGKFRSLSFVLGALVELWQRRREYSILHAHLAFGPAFAGVLAARLLGKRAIVKLGNSGEYGDIQVSRGSLRGRLRLAAFRRWADAVIVLDEAMQAEALQAGFDPRRVRRMSNGIDTRRFEPSMPRAQAKAALGLTGRLVVLSVGRLAAQKSLDVLLRACAAASSTCAELHLLVLGDGPERASLQSLAQNLQLDPRITFAGSQADVRPYLQAADIFALPSASEGISNALLEAMSAGLACLASPVGGSPEVLDGGRCGSLLPVGDVNAWAAEISRLAHSPAERERLGQAAQSRARSEYDFEVTGARYEALYAALCGAPQPGVKSLADVKP